MAQLHKSAVTLRIAGDDLVPDEISRLLGASPTESQTKGQEFVGPKTGIVRIAKFGMWRLCAPDREPEDMDGQIHELLSQVTGDLSVWRRITERYDVDLFCGLFMRVGNEGLTISAKCLADLGARGIEIGLDIYSGDDDGDDTST
jgi:hypothetical protein